MTPWNKKELLTLECKKCSKEFNVQPYRKDAKFCSIACSRKGADRSKGYKKWSEESRKKVSLQRKGMKHSIETRLKMSKIHKNKPTWNSKGGVTPINESIRKSVQYKLWREAVFKRDNWICVWCGLRSKVGQKVTLNADHIKPFALFPELRFAIDNGRTLCEPCHRTTDTYGPKARLLYKVDKSIKLWP